MKTLAFLLLLATATIRMANSAPDSDIEKRVSHGYAESNGVRIHYASLGEGPLVVMLHGFPDYWYTWRHQMEALAEDHQVVALDLRGYNLSDKPQGVENYDMRLLVGDVASCHSEFGATKGDYCGPRLNTC